MRKEKTVATDDPLALIVSPDSRNQLLRVNARDGSLPAVLELLIRARDGEDLSDMLGLAAEVNERLISTDLARELSDAIAHEQAAVREMGPVLVEVPHLAGRLKSYAEYRALCLAVRHYNFTYATLAEQMESIYTSRATGQHVFREMESDASGPVPNWAYLVLRMHEFTDPIAMLFRMLFFDEYQFHQGKGENAGVIFMVWQDVNTRL